LLRTAVDARAPVRQGQCKNWQAKAKRVLATHFWTANRSSQGFHNERWKN